MDELTRLEDNPDAPEVKAAEDAIWRHLRQGLEDAGQAEAGLYLQHLVAARLAGETREGPFRRLRFDLLQRLSDYAVSYNARTEERTSWYFSALKEGTEPALGRDACLKIAQKAGDPPPDAVLEMAQFEEQGGESVFVASWGHRQKGIPVEGDFIQVLVNGKTGRVFGWRRRWHDVDAELTER